jgi:catechol 2,3-dioxygenase-like lactoylglutathione lyase family enzyme
MLTIGGLVLGVDDLPRATRFWTLALGYLVDADDSSDRWAALRHPEGAGPPLFLQLSETPVQEHPRLHLDLHARDLAERTAEVRRLVGLGASLVDWDRYPEDPDFVVLADPDMNRFCVIDASHVKAERAERTAAPEETG